MINVKPGTVLSLTLGGSVALDAWGRPQHPVVSRVTKRDIIAIENVTGDPCVLRFSRVSGRQRGGFAFIAL